jgi:hypothetical protein
MSRSFKINIDIAEVKVRKGIHGIDPKTKVFKDKKKYNRKKKHKNENF